MTKDFWVVVSNIFQMGWNHQLDLYPGLGHYKIVIRTRRALCRCNRKLCSQLGRCGAWGRDRAKQRDYAKFVGYKVLADMILFWRVYYKFIVYKFIVCNSLRREDVWENLIDVLKGGTHVELLRKTDGKPWKCSDEEAQCGLDESCKMQGNYPYFVVFNALDQAWLAVSLNCGGMSSEFGFHIGL